MNPHARARIILFIALLMGIAVAVKECVGWVLG